MREYGLIALSHVTHVIIRTHIPPFKVVIGVIAYRMAGLNNLQKHLRMFVYILPHHKERRFDVIAGQDFQHFRRYLRYRTIVESQIHSLTRTENTVRIKPLKNIF